MKRFIKKIMGLGVIVGLLFETFPVWALVKDETIYAKLDNNGQVNKVIISEHLQETGDKQTFDRSKLDEIKNVNGDEKFTNENGKLVWESNGKDIYYQGQTKEELPISLKISYFFNGKESTIKEMLGKKGTVKMVLKYSNNDKHEAYINGKYTTLYTPFVVATTTILSSDNNYNIKVKNGKVIGNGTNNIVVLLSTPGLYESLGIDKLKGMDEAEITFDTDSFELSSIYSVSTPKLIDRSDLDILNNIDGIYNSVNTLVDSSNKLKNGSSQLLSGANQLKDGIIKLMDGVNSAYNGSKQITDSVAYSINTINSDDSPAISDEKLAGIKAQAEAGAEQTINATFTDEYKTGIAEQAGNTAKSSVNSTFTDEYKDGIGTQAVTSLNQNENYANLKTNVNALIAGYEANEEFMTLLNTCSSSPTLEICQQNQASIGSYKILKQLVSTIEGTVYNTAISTAYNTAIATAENTAKQTAVSTAYQTASTTAKQTAGQTSTTIAQMVAEEAKKTAKESTSTSLQTLLNALTQLTNGLNELNNGMVSLDTGTSTLKDGISALDNGIYQFNSQGINKISNLVNGDLKTVEEKVKALGKLSLSYGTFDDSETGTEGATKIIMVVDEIKPEQSNIKIVDKIIDDTESLWEKVKENSNKDKNKK